MGRIIENVQIRKANIKDLEQVAELERICFPESEAATRDSLKRRLEKYAESFYVLIISDRVVSMVNGMVTSLPDLTDEMYENEKLHDPAGDWQMIFGVDTHPDYRKQGLAAATLNAFLDHAKRDGRKGAVLTCKEKLIPYYEKFGFVSEGVSQSSHGNAVWYQMRLKFH